MLHGDRVPEPMTRSPRAVTVGESMGLIQPNTVGSFALLDALQLSFGGAESNVAIGLARLGIAVSWMGRVGDDSIGRRIVRELRAEGIDVHAPVDPSARTAVMLKERSGLATEVWYYRNDSAGSRLSPSDLDVQRIASADLLHLTGITPALSASAGETIDTALQIAQASGVPVSFDVNHRSKLWSAREAAPVYRRIASASAVVFAGLDEASIMLGVRATPDETLDRIAELGPRQVVLKLGGDGCLALIDGERYRLDAIPIVPLDTVGAGDAFVAGYLAELLAGELAPIRLSTAVATGAMACLSAGDWEGAPDRAALRRALEDEPVRR